MVNRMLNKRLMTKTVGALFAITVSQVVYAANVSSNTDDAFTQALNMRDTGDLEAAIQSFQDLLSSEPTLGRVRAELALSYFKALNFSAARQQAQQLLEDPNTPPSVKANIEKLIAMIDKESSPHVFTPYVNLGIGHDTNINVGPSTSTINIGGAQLVAGATAQSSNFTNLNVGVAHRYLAPNAVSAFGRNAAVLWNSNASYYRNNFLESGDYDLNVLSLSTGPMLAVANRWRAGVDLTYDYIELGHSKLAEFVGIAPSVSFNLNRVTDLTVNASLQQRNFDDNKAQNRDSDYQMLGASLTRSFANGKYNLQAGANVFNENVKDKTFSNDGYQLTAGLNFKPNEIDSLYVRHSYKQMDFDAPVVLFNEKRDERENRSTIGFSHRFTHKLVSNWLMDSSITYTENAANLPIYQYYRTQFALNFSKQF